MTLIITFLFIGVVLGVGAAALHYRQQADTITHLRRQLVTVANEALLEASRKEVSAAWRDSDEAAQLRRERDAAVSDAEKARRQLAACQAAHAYGRRAATQYQRNQDRKP